MKRILCMVALATLTMMSSYAQSVVSVKVDELVKKYDEVKGVNCITVSKKIGLELFKKKFAKQLGKEFMRGVTGITIIEYSDASEQTCQDFRKELDVFASLLEEFGDKEEEKDPDQDYTRCFGSVSKEDATLSDFLITIEDDEQKMFLYMEGVMKVGEDKLTFDD